MNRKLHNSITAFAGSAAVFAAVLLLGSPVVDADAEATALLASRTEVPTSAPETIADPPAASTDSGEAAATLVAAATAASSTAAALTVGAPRNAAGGTFRRSRQSVRMPFFSFLPQG